MTSDAEGFHDRADFLAVCIECEIAQGEQFLDDLAEFEERSEEARRMDEVIHR